jgi:hypothetical protein
MSLHAFALKTLMGEALSIPLAGKVVLLENVASL